MNKLINFKVHFCTLFIVLLGFCAQGQENFAKVPIYQSNSQCVVYNSVEIDNYYYFQTGHTYYLNNVFYNRTSIHKTDINGIILDSLIIKIDNIDSNFQLTMDSEGQNLVTYFMTAQVDSANFSKRMKLGRYRFDKNLNLLDSFITTEIADTNFLRYSNWLVKNIDGKIYFIIKGYNKTLPNLSNSQDIIYVVDTNGAFLFSKKLRNKNQAIQIFDLITTTGNNIICNSPGFDSLTNYSGGMILSLDDSLNIISWGGQPNDYDISKGGFDKFSADKISIGYVMNPFNQPDSLCVDIWDTNYNIMKHKCIPRHSMFNGQNISNFQTERFDGSNPNSIYLGTNWGNDISLLQNSYFTLSNLDSNLNIRWSKVFGGDFPYFIWRYQSTNDGGCFILGTRRLGSTLNDTVQPVIFKISQTGIITNIKSFSTRNGADFKLFPNPTQERFYIQATTKDKYTISVYDLSGKLQLQTNNKVGQAIDVSHLVAGSYFVQIQTEQRAFFKQLIISP